MRWLGGGLLLLLGACSAPGDGEVVADSMPAFPSSRLDAWHRHLWPRGDELAWREIPWRTSFVEGIRQADAQVRPLLFWAMNGHPLGNT